MLRRYWLWRREQTELALADLEHHRARWSWSYKPSRWALVEKREALLTRRLTAIQKRLGIADSNHREEAGG